MDLWARCHQCKAAAGGKLGGAYELCDACGVDEPALREIHYQRGLEGQRLVHRRLELVFTGEIELTVDGDGRGSTLDTTLTNNGAGVVRSPTAKIAESRLASIRTSSPIR